MSAVVIHDGTHNEEKVPYRFLFHCPACGCSHSFQTEEDQFCPHKWTWNGSYEKPTVRPSINYNKANPICHFHLTDGKIEYQPDCTHAMAGQTVDMIPWDRT